MKLVTVGDCKLGGDTKGENERLIQDSRSVNLRSEKLRLEIYCNDTQPTFYSSYVFLKLIFGALLSQIDLATNEAVLVFA